MTDIQNLSTFDPFADSSGQDGRSSSYIHVRVQQRVGRKTLTTVQGIPNEYCKSRLVKAFKKEFACNGTIIEHDEYGEVIQLQGDKRNQVCEFLVKYDLASKDQLKIHGF